ncbi:uncharacterized protein BDZ99DRAFT_525099 [Mytilinidion resinicola]|uniref:Uncharacterized protein n=1 Tax=Mytilinidion resinicola TaxID=574789 RepID=A0A6A6Y9U7_9PEZI|nr:uncharacterized protein BDZ99DRAFT_525099 [Mytilinidion resinicola]KAF2805399.1 hypothetical protein BDZ99DRAFT_525099 [Mytilinidion resinicola]
MDKTLATQRSTKENPNPICDEKAPPCTTDPRPTTAKAPANNPRASPQKPPQPHTKKPTRTAIDQTKQATRNPRNPPKENTQRKPQPPKPSHRKQGTKEQLDQAANNTTIPHKSKDKSTPEESTNTPPETHSTQTTYFHPTTTHTKPTKGTQPTSHRRKTHNTANQTDKKNQAAPKNKTNNIPRCEKGTAAGSQEEQKLTPTGKNITRKRGTKHSKRSDANETIKPTPTAQTNTNQYATSEQKTTTPHHKATKIKNQNHHAESMPPKDAFKMRETERIGPTNKKHSPNKRKPQTALYLPKKTQTQPQHNEAQHQAIQNEHRKQKPDLATKEPTY